MPSFAVLRHSLKSDDHHFPSCTVPPALGVRRSTIDVDHGRETAVELAAGKPAHLPACCPMLNEPVTIQRCHVARLDQMFRCFRFSNREGQTPSSKDDSLLGHKRKLDES
ncbi:uncharacterized protein UDID_17634 [Ustilago sp. UG-2017a]|nr:uncharacterized protein UDID_17634 [Ustilago sp. UG-2017a]